MAEALLTPDEVAHRLQVRERTVLGWLRAGRLRGYKLGGRLWRVPPDAVDAFLEARSNRAAWRRQFEAALAEFRRPVPRSIPDAELDADLIGACEEVRAEIDARRR